MLFNIVSLCDVASEVLINIIPLCNEAWTNVRNFKLITRGIFLVAKKAYYVSDRAVVKQILLTGQESTIFLCWNEKTKKCQLLTNLKENEFASWELEIVSLPTLLDD